VPVKARAYKKRNYTERLFKRFSEITGVPLKQLKPKKIADRNISGIYDSRTHEYHQGIMGKKRLKTLFGRHVEEHELRHGLQNLSMKENLLADRKVMKVQKLKLLQFLKWLKKDSSWTRKWIEATNSDPQAFMAIQAFGDMGAIKAGLLGAASVNVLAHPFLSFVAYAYLLPQYITQTKRHSNVRKLIKKHGEDGILLLWVAPPKKQDALQITKWEKEMVKKGYLKEDGGMTKKGLQYFRRHLQPAAIWKKLKELEYKRKNKETIE
jgi:hypothetical protein